MCARTHATLYALVRMCVSSIASVRVCTKRTHVMQMCLCNWVRPCVHRARMRFERARLLGDDSDGDNDEWWWCVVV